MSRHLGDLEPVPEATNIPSIPDLIHELTVGSVLTTGSTHLFLNPNP